MTLKLLVFMVAAVACARAIVPIGYAAPAYASPAYAAPSITSQQANILRSYGNLGQVSTYSKSIDTPFSSVRKSDVRISNPGLTYAGPAFAPAISPGIVAPPLTHGVLTPGLGPGVLAPKAVVGAGLLGVAYSAAPAVAHTTFSNALGYNYAW